MFGPRDDKPKKTDYSEEEIRAHCDINKYGDFELSEGIRPWLNLKVIPTEGYRYDKFLDEETREILPVIMASATRHKLFDLFLSLTEVLNDEVDVVLKASHHTTNNDHDEFLFEKMDNIVVRSALIDFEQIL